MAEVRELVAKFVDYNFIVLSQHKTNTQDLC